MWDDEEEGVPDVADELCVELEPDDVDDEVPEDEVPEDELPDDEGDVPAVAC